MRKADASGDKRPQLPLAVLQHIEKAERELVKVRVKCFRIRMSGRVALAETRVVAAPHEFGLRILGQRIINEGAETQPAIHAQAIDNERIVDRIRSTRLIADERRHFPFCDVVPLPNAGEIATKDSMNMSNSGKRYRIVPPKNDWP